MKLQECVFVLFLETSQHGSPSRNEKAWWNLTSRGVERQHVLTGGTSTDSFNHTYIHIQKYICSYVCIYRIYAMINCFCLLYGCVFSNNSLSITKCFFCLRFCTSLFLASCLFLESFWVQFIFFRGLKLLATIDHAKGCEVRRFDPPFSSPMILFGNHPCSRVSAHSLKRMMPEENGEGTAREVKLSCSVAPFFHFFGDCQ